MEAGMIFAEHYQLLKLIGEGSFGNVWLAKDIKADLAVAIKIYITLDERGVREFMDEFKLTFNLNHTHILHAYHYDVFAKQPFLVMPYCEKGSALSLVGNINEEQLWHFLMDVSAGLTYLHGQEPNPIIHQDIKPDNILIGKNGAFLITDFGISQQMRSTLRRNSSRMASAGSTAYMPPERFLSKSASTSAGDIWSLGASMIELITGELPFCGLGGNMQNGGAELPELPSISKELKVIIYSCMSKNPNDRPTAKELLQLCDKHYRQKDNSTGNDADKSIENVPFQLVKKCWGAIVVLIFVIIGCCGLFVWVNTPTDGSLSINTDYEVYLPGLYTCKQKNGNETVGKSMVAEIEKKGDGEYSLSVISSDIGTTHSTFRYLSGGILESEVFGKGSIKFNPKLETVMLVFEKQGIKLELFK